MRGEKGRGTQNQPRLPISSPTEFSLRHHVDTSRSGRKRTVLISPEGGVGRDWEQGILGCGNIKGRHEEYGCSPEKRLGIQCVCVCV